MKLFYNRTIYFNTCFLANNIIIAYTINTKANIVIDY